MIDIKTLMVGSHVNVCGHRRRVAAIDALNGKIGLDGYADNDEFLKHPIGYKAEDVEPIPLTKDLLKELGFECIDNIYWVRWSIGRFCLVSKDNSLYFIYDGQICVKYLHEIENIFYMIYDKELIND